MARVIWEGIPEKYWPSTDRPWRVAWGIGMFEDFATEEEAEQFRNKLIADGTEGVGEVFQACEV